MLPKEGQSKMSQPEWPQQVTHLPEWHDKVVSFLGQQVDVLLALKGSPADYLGIAKEAEHRIVSGKLLGFGDGGDFEILGDDGFVHHAWPMLDVRSRVPIQERYPC